MAAPRAVRSPCSAFKRLRIQPSTFPTRPLAQITSASITTSAPNNAEPAYQEGVPVNVQEMIREDLFDLAASRNIPLPPTLQPTPASPARVPRSLTALHRAPARRPATHNATPTATLQLRSYSARNLETMADFALRAAYYLNLPARGPVPLPRITERWTVPKSVFVHKKAQENWERITMRRLIQIVDGEAEGVRRWLAFVRRWCWYGVGMKANVWEWEGLETSAEEAAREIEAGRRQSDWRLFGRRADLVGKEAVGEYLDNLGFAADEGVKTVRKPKAKTEKTQLAETDAHGPDAADAPSLPQAHTDADHPIAEGHNIDAIAAHVRDLQQQSLQTIQAIEAINEASLSRAAGAAVDEDEDEEEDEEGDDEDDDEDKDEEEDEEEDEDEDDDEDEDEDEETDSDSDSDSDSDDDNDDNPDPLTTPTPAPT